MIFIIYFFIFICDCFQSFTPININIFIINIFRE
jgi:hypothetical protein